MWERGRAIHSKHRLDTKNMRTKLKPYNFNVSAKGGRWNLKEG